MMTNIFMVSCLGIVLMSCQFMVCGIFMMKVTPPLCGLQCFNVDIWCYLNTWEADLILNLILYLSHDYLFKTNHGLLYQVSWLNQYLFPGGCWKVLPGVNYCFKALFMKGIKYRVEKITPREVPCSRVAPSHRYRADGATRARVRHFSQPDKVFRAGSPSIPKISNVDCGAIWLS